MIKNLIFGPPLFEGLFVVGTLRQVLFLLGLVIIPAGLGVLIGYLISKRSPRPWPRSELKSAE